MDLIYLLIFICLAIAILSLSGLFEDNAVRRAGARHAKEQRESILGKKQSRLDRFINKIEHLLVIAKINRSTFIAATVLVSIILASIGYFLFSNILVVLTCALFAFPVAYVALQIRSYSYLRLMSNQLEHTMSLITNTYKVTQDIQKAIELNINDITPSEPFVEFLAEISLVDPNFNRALRRLEAKVDNEYFSEWIDLVIMSQSDRNMIFILPAIIEEMNDAKNSRVEADTQMASLWRSYFISLVLVISIPLMLKFVNREWYALLVYEPLGIALIVVLLLCLMYSFWRVAKIMRPVK
jgi:hypothetical protein